MRVLIFVFSIISLTGSYRSRRLRRQNVPSQHVQVFAFESRLNLEGGTSVDSDENRIDYTERDLKGSMWSDHSLLKLNNIDSSSKATADRPEVYFNIQGLIQIHSQGAKGDASLMTDRGQSGFTSLEHNVIGGANFSFDDSALKVQGIGGKKIGIEAETWNNNIQKLITFEAVTCPDGERELRIEAVDKPYHAVICYVGAIVYFQYAGKSVRMDPTYRFIEIWTDKYTITVKTEKAPFNVTMRENEIVLLLKDENTRVCVFVGGVAIQSGQLTKTHIDRNGGQMSIAGKPVAADGVMITALNTDLKMSNEGKVDSNTDNSYLMIQTNGQQVGFTARHHNLKINDGIPHIILDPGMSVIEISTNHEAFELSALMESFQPPPDKFLAVGPFQESRGGGYGYPQGNYPPGGTVEYGEPNPNLNIVEAPEPPPKVNEQPAAAPPTTPLPAPTAPVGPQSAPSSSDMAPPPPPIEAPPPPSPMKLHGFPPGLDVLGAGFAADMPPPAKKVMDDTDMVKNRTNTTSIQDEITNAITATTAPNLDVLKPGFAADMPDLNQLDRKSNVTETLKNMTDVTSITDTTRDVVDIPVFKQGSERTDLSTHSKNRTIDDTDTVNRLDEDSTVTDTLKNKKKPKLDPKLLKQMSADVPQTVTTIEVSSTTKVSTTSTIEASTTATERTTMNPTTTTTATTTSTIPMTTTTTPMPTTTPTTTTTTTTETTTTTTLSPMEEIKKLKEEMAKREKQFREWKTESTSNDGDGEEHVEEFTYPNGTTVHRVVKTRRKITTTVIHKHREEINETSSNGTSKGKVEIGEKKTPLTTKKPPASDPEEDLFAASFPTRPPTVRKGTLAPGETLPTIAPLQKKWKMAE